jgi:hypothetical protein
MPAKVALAHARDNGFVSPARPSVLIQPDSTARCGYTVHFVRRLGGFAATTAALSAARSGLAVESS